MQLRGPFIRKNPQPSGGLYMDDNVKLKVDGSVNRLPRAVKSGEHLFNADWSVDRWSSLLRQGRVILDENGLIDAVAMGLLPASDENNENYENENEAEEDENANDNEQQEESAKGETAPKVTFFKSPKPIRYK